MSTFHLHVLFSFLSSYEFNYCCLYAYGCGTILQNMDKLPVAIFLKKYHFLGPSSHQLPTIPQMGWSLLTCSPIWAGILTDLMVRRLCKQVTTAVLSRSEKIMACVEDSIWQHSSSPLTPMSFLSPLPWGCLSLCNDSNAIMSYIGLSLSIHLF